jgi:hypothetical protein
MRRGGKRTGAGRKPGTPNKVTQECRTVLSEEADFRSVVRRLVVMSKRKDAVAFNACRLLFEYQIQKLREADAADLTEQERDALRKIAADVMREMV